MFDDNFVLGYARGILERRGDGLSPSDLATLQVALMVAALDGRVSPHEYAVFDSLAARCPGMTPETVAQALDRALRSAGYVLLQSARVPLAELTALFLKETEGILAPASGEADAPRLKSALRMWLAMALSDGDYSREERACVEALFERLRDGLKNAVLSSLEKERFRMGVYAAGDALASEADSRVEELLPADFLSRVEKEIREFGVLHNQLI